MSDFFNNIYFLMLNITRDITGFDLGVYTKIMPQAALKNISS